MITFETRHKANETVDRNKRYSQIIECLMESGELTAKECAVLMTKKGYIPIPERNYTAPRMTELVQNKRLSVVGKKVCVYTGKKVAVYALNGG